MSPVLASTSTFGVSPWLAGAGAPAARLLSAVAAGTVETPPGSGRAERVRTALTWSGVRLG